MSTLGVWLAVVTIGLGTYLIRFSFLFLFEHLSTVPAPLERALRYVPPAVLAALVFPAMLGDGGASIVLGNHRLLAGGIAAVVAWRTESVFATIVVGLLALVALQMLPIP